MKFIKTYWHNLEGINSADYYHEIKREPLYCFILSSLFLTKYHEVEVYTDIEGEKIITLLQVPFTRINIVVRPSNRYSSVNDMYVLSLQNEPVTLISDNILSMGRLDIEINKHEVMVLGIELNSIKLVKSVLKINRIEPLLPGFDDSLWLEKTAYADNSMLAVSDGAVINKYLKEVLKFIEVNVTALSELTNDAINNFVKTYWFYSYFKFNGFDFKTYLPSSIAIGYSGELFDFSSNNISLNIFKIIDNNYSNTNFSKQFFKLFRLYFNRHFVLLEEYLNPGSGSSSKVIPDHFIRTLQALKRSKIDVQEEIAALVKSVSTGSLRRLVVKIKNSEVGLEIQRISDVFKFEKYLRRVNEYYLSNVEEILDQQQTAFNKLLELWDDPHFDHLQIQINPYVFLYESEWKWCTPWVAGVDNLKVAELKVVYNSSNLPSYFITAFVPSSEMSPNHEFNLDRKSAEIIDFFSGTHSIRDFLNSREVSFSDTREVPLDIRDLYYDKIRELIQINILSIHES